MSAAALDAEPLFVGTSKTPLLVFAAFFIALILMLHPTAMDMARLWAKSSSYTHGFFIAPLALWMIIKHAPIRFDYANRLEGYGIAIIGNVLWLLGAAAGAALITQVALVTILIGGVGIIFGRQALTDWAYPLGFLYFMVPFGEIFVPYLQTITANIVVGLMAGSGMDVSLDGYLIDTPGGAFEIAVACAGLKFLIAATVIAAVYSYISFTTWRSRFVFLAFTVAVSIFANGLRAFFLVLIATLTEKRLAVGPDHILIGWLFYGAVFGILFWIGRKYASPRIDETRSVAAAPSFKFFACAPLFAILAATAIYNGAVINRTIDRTAPTALSAFNAPGWRILPAPANWSPSLAHTDNNIVATYQQENQTVYLAAGYVTHDRRGAEIVGHDTRAYDGEIWRRHGEQKNVLYQFGRSELVTVELLAGPARRKLAAVNAYWLDDEVFLDRTAMKLAQMNARLQGRNPSGGVVIMAASYHENPREAIDQIRNFSADVETMAAWRARNFGR